MKHVATLSRVLVAAGIAVVTHWPVGTPYKDPGAVALDNYDGPVDVRTQGADRVNWRIPGQYTVTYRAADRSGNSASAVRTVIVDSRASQ
jgi:hypothetical protein